MFSNCTRDPIPHSGGKKKFVTIFSSPPPLPTRRVSWERLPAQYHNPFYMIGPVTGRRPRLFGCPRSGKNGMECPICGFPKLKILDDFRTVLLLCKKNARSFVVDLCLHFYDICVSVWSSCHTRITCVRSSSDLRLHFWCTCARALAVRVAL